MAERYIQVYKSMASDIHLVSRAQDISDAPRSQAIA
jgi:hypothetical protein